MIPQYSTSTSYEDLPPLTLTQQQVNQLYDQEFAAADGLSRGRSVVDLANSKWGEILDRFYQERIVYLTSSNVLLLRFSTSVSRAERKAGADHPVNREVDLDLIKKPIDLLSTVACLNGGCGKNWMSKERIRYFILAVCAIKKWKLSFIPWD